MRSYRAAAVAACGLVLVLLAACGAGPLRVGPAGGPESVRMGNFTQAFASALPADPSRAIVVQRFREGLVLWDRSQTAFRLVTPVRDYVTGQALSNLVRALRNDQARDVVPAGTDRLFMTQVASIGRSQAVISTCDDGSRFRFQNPHTGRVDQAMAAQPQQEYISETFRMGVLHGHWAITGLSVTTLPSQGAERCQPGLAAGTPRPPAMPVLLKAVAAAMRGASSVHVGGTASQGGKTLRLDLGMTRSGGMYGQIAEGGADLTVLITGGRVYLRVNAALLRLGHAPSSLCKVVCGKYLRMSAHSRGLAGLSMPAFMASVTRSITRTPAGKVSFGGTIAVGGEPAWVLLNGHGTALVAARGWPYLLRITQPGQGTVSFTQWNAVRIPGPPPASQVLKPRQLGGQFPRSAL